MFRKKFLIAVILVLALSALATAVYADGLVSATGSAHYYLPDVTYWTQILSVTKHADGSVSGQTQAVAHAKPIRVAHGEFDCLQIMENTPRGDIAFLSGWITKAINPSPGIPLPGYVTYFVVDGGEGPDAADYLSSFVIVTDPQVFNCEIAYLNGPENWPGYAWIPVNGEIQVIP